MRQIAISSNLFAQFPRRQALEYTRRLGFRYIDLWSSPAFVQHLNPTNESPDVVRKELEQFDIKPISASIYFTTYDEKLELFSYAARVGIPYVTFEIAPRSDFLEHMSNLSIHDRTLIKPGAGWAVFRNTMLKLLDVAEKVGIRIALQVPHVYTLIERIEEFNRFREELRHPALYFALSPTHTIARGSDIFDFISACGDRLAVLHLWNVKPDYKAEKDGRKWGTPKQQLALKGYFDFPSLLQRKESEKAEFLCVKCHGTESWDDAKQIMNVVMNTVEVLSL